MEMAEAVEMQLAVAPMTVAEVGGSEETRDAASGSSNGSDGSGNWEFGTVGGRGRRSIEGVSRAYKLT